MNRPDFDALSGKERQKALKDYLDPCCRVFDEVPWWSNGNGDVSGIRTALYLCDPAAGTAQKVTPDLFNVVTLDCVCGRVVYTGEERRGLQKRQERALPARSGEPAKAARSSSRVHIPSARTMPFDGNTVFVQMAEEGQHTYYSGDLYAVDLESGGKKRRLCAFEHSLFDAVNTDALYGGAGRTGPP